MRQLLMMALVYAMLLALACAGTAGRNFVKEKQGFEISKVMGMSTAELEKEFGQPQNIFYRGRPDYSRETYLYHYTEKTETSLSSRTLRTELENGKVIGYIYTSGFQPDSTKFDEKIFSRLRLGMTEQETEKLIGKFNGTASMPSTLIDTATQNSLKFSKGDRMRFLQYTTHNLKNRLSGIYEKFLILVYDKSTGKVKDFYFYGQE